MALLGRELRRCEALCVARARARAAREQGLHSRCMALGRGAVQEREAVVEAAALGGGDGGRTAVEQRSQLVGRARERQLVRVRHARPSLLY
eukprot:2190917-Prymnesium_polylepis.1